MATIIVNGVSYTGNNVTVRNGHVVVDGKEATPDSKQIDITVKGNIEVLAVDACHGLSVNGDVNCVTVGNADVTVTGNINGYVKSQNGDVTCGNVSGDVSTATGDINYRK